MGYFIFKKRIFKEYNSVQSYTDFVLKSVNYLIIMPLNDLDFANSFDVAKYFKIHKKDITLFIPEHKVNMGNISTKYKYISYDLDDITNLGLPTKKFVERLKEHKFDVVIDLERENNLFFAAITCIVEADFKVGFRKSEIDNLYNFQLVNTKINSEIS